MENALDPTLISSLSTTIAPRSRWAGRHPAVAESSRALGLPGDLAPSLGVLPP
jgi:hypothetical protein